MAHKWAQQSKGAKGSERRESGGNRHGGGDNVETGIEKSGQTANKRPWYNDKQWQAQKGRNMYQ